LLFIALDLKALRFELLQLSLFSFEINRTLLVSSDSPFLRDTRVVVVVLVVVVVVVVLVW
jgi:hypothetical protein